MLESVLNEQPRRSLAAIFQRLMANQRLVHKEAENDKPYPRTAVGLDKQGKTLLLVLIDDKQPLYSEGVTLKELADVLAGYGAYKALNLDGGGSTTLVVETPAGPRVLNAPIHTKIPLRERPIANHLGFYAQPINMHRQ